MRHEEIIKELHELAQNLGVTVRYEKGDFDGGYCILKAEKILLVNKRLHPRRKASVLAVGMQEIGLENVFIRPAVREFIEDEVTKTLHEAR
jgi:hypothetical protein